MSVGLHSCCCQSDGQFLSVVHPEGLFYHRLAENRLRCATHGPRQPLSFQTIAQNLQFSRTLLYAVVVGPDGESRLASLGIRATVARYAIIVDFTGVCHRSAVKDAFAVIDK